MKFTFKNIILLSFFILSIININCVQNLTKCPLDTLKMSMECEGTEEDTKIKNQAILGIVVLSSSNSLSGKSLEFFNILMSYRTNGSYTLTNGTSRKFLNSSKCSSTIQNPALNRAAQKHTDNMLVLNFFDHTGKDGSTPSTRVKAEGLNVSLVGENIAAGQSTAESVFDAWWNSSGHRSNMENCSYTHVGIGYATNTSSSSNYSDYWTNVFAAIK
ncbi:MAG: CAP domain-containing protein [Spirochaetia bacterium]|nr:CAP domain-containing protein [Spirochaetia bacterium]